METAFAFILYAIGVFIAVSAFGCFAALMLLIIRAIAED